MKKLVVIILLTLFVCILYISYQRSVSRIELSDQVSNSYLNSLQKAFIHAILAKNDREQAINLFENAVYEKIELENIPFTRQAYETLLPFYRTKIRELGSKDKHSIIYELENMHSAGELLAHLYWIDEQRGKNAGIVIRKPTVQDTTDEQPNTPEDREMRRQMGAQLEAEIEALRKKGADVDELLNMPMSGVPDFYEIIDGDDRRAKKLFFKDYHVPHHDWDSIATAVENIMSSDREKGSL